MIGQEKYEPTTVSLAWWRVRRDSPQATQINFMI
jgi:hypothetical protein